MAQMGRPGLSVSQKEDMWRRWKLGESHSDIGRALGKQAASIHGSIRIHGGIAPLPRKRSSRALHWQEREEISRGIAAGCSLRSIARSIGRAASTVSREIARNGGPQKYRANVADEAAWNRARRPKPCRLKVASRLRRAVAVKLRKNWSPEQISGWLKREYRDDDTMQISHETIYRTLYIQARGALKRELMAHLRTRRMMRRSKKSTTRGQPRGQIIDAISISERPAEVEDRAIPGHWEGDLISGSNNTHIATLVERQSRYTMLVKLNGKDTKTVVNALIKQVRRLPSELRLSMTWDRGTEMARHKDFSIATGFEVYFCDPQSPWQRGTNENTNRLLRQYFPKKTDLSPFSQADLNSVALQLNQRPRKTLGFASPAERFNECVALTG
jgi:IS30 family transposase